MQDMARIQMKTVLLAVLAMACTRSAYGTVELIDAALQAKASELESLKGQGSGTTSTTTQIGYGQGSSVTSGWQPPPTGAASLASWPQCIMAALPVHHHVMLCEYQKGMHWVAVELNSIHHVAQAVFSRCLDRQQADSWPKSMLSISCTACWSNGDTECTLNSHTLSPSLRSL